MKTKAALPAELIENKSLSAMVETYFEVVQLKQLFRQGWLRKGVPIENCESVAEHSFGVALLALLTAETYFPEIDGKKVVAMALLHDLGEAYAGDFTPADGVSSQKRQTLERQAIEKIVLKLPKGAKYLELWEEHEAGISAEARLVRELDRIEMSLQAAVYHQQSLLVEPNEFFNATKKVLSSPVLEDILSELEDLCRRD